MRSSNIVQKARDAFRIGCTGPIDFRERQLKQLIRMLEENTSEILEALTKDMQKPSRSLLNAMDTVLIYNDPYGVVLIMGTWNYPIQLIVMPLIGAIAAGNCAIIKPSELCPASADLLARLILKYLDQDCFHVILGGVLETTVLFKERFDYIFFTGSVNVGKIVRAASNEHLTPVTLELGRKSPVFVDSTADMELTARRILWGKFVNAGQTCSAPDYVLCSKAVQASFVAKAKEVLREWYGSNVKNSPDYCCIVSDKHFNFRYPPSSEGKVNLIRFALGKLRPCSIKILWYHIISVVGVEAAVLFGIFLRHCHLL